MMLYLEYQLITAGGSPINGRPRGSKTLIFTKNDSEY